jgi:ligand-binding sensor domain-containing protein
VATRWTVSRKGEAGWSDLTPDVAEPDPAFTAVIADGGSEIWVGSRSGALYRFDGHLWLRYARPHSVSTSIRDARAFSREDWALLGTTPMRGVDGTWTAFAGWDSTAAVVDVAVSPAGEWFAATRDRVLRYDAKRDAWQDAHGSGLAPAKSGSMSRAITAIAFDATGRLFIGTGDGVGCLAAGKTRWWNVVDGIGGERVSDLATDGSALWIGYGEDGLSVIPLAALR